MKDQIVVRIVIVSVILGLSALDIALIASGRASITSQCRWLNEQSGWLLALILGAIWIHLFIVPWFTK